MSQRNNFTRGFLFGAFIGGTVGGIIGAIVASRSAQNRAVDFEAESPLPANKDETSERLSGDRQADLPPRQSLYRRRMSEARMENARRSLEGKIAQLNDAIDDVRQQFEEPSK